MSLQFNRSATVDVGIPGSGTATRVEGLRIIFDVKKDVTQTLNKAEIRIYNLSPTTLAAFSDIDAAILLRAGYLDGAGLSDVFVGSVSRIYSQREGADIVTYVVADDGKVGLQRGQLELTFKPGSSALTALKKVAASTGLPIRFMAVVADKPFLTGWQHSGPTLPALNSLTQRLGLEWTIQNGALVFVKQGAVAAKTTAAAQAIAPLVTPESGLLGSLEKNAMLKDTGKSVKGQAKRYGWKGRCLLMPALVPGDPIALRALSLPTMAVFRIERLRHKGDTHGADWETEFVTSDRAVA